MVIVGGEMVIRESRCTTPVIENPTLLTRQPVGIRIVNTPTHLQLYDALLLRSCNKLLTEVRRLLLPFICIAVSG